MVQKTFWGEMGIAAVVDEEFLYCFFYNSRNVQCFLQLKKTYFLYSLCEQVGAPCPLFCGHESSFFFTPFLGCCYVLVCCHQPRKVFTRILVDASVLQWGKIKTRKLYPSIESICNPVPPVLYKQHRRDICYCLLLPPTSVQKLRQH